MRERRPTQETETLGAAFARARKESAKTNGKDRLLLVANPIIRGRIADAFKNAKIEERDGMIWVFTK